MEGDVSSRVSRWRRAQGLSCDYVIKDRTDRGGGKVAFMIEVRPIGNAMQLELLTKDSASVAVSTSGQAVKGRVQRV
jgi:hypothetical protein